MFILLWKFVAPEEAKIAVWNMIADRVQDLASWLRPAVVK
jgi:hypothetical protein